MIEILDPGKKLVTALGQSLMKVSVNHRDSGEFEAIMRQVQYYTNSLAICLILTLVLSQITVQL